jgi:hypothetical protein
MSDNGDQAPKRELTPMERFVGIEKAKHHAGMINAAYNVIVYPAVWFRENVSSNSFYELIVSSIMKQNIFCLVILCQSNFTCLALHLEVVW